MRTPIYLWLLLVITVTSSPLAISPTTAHKQSLTLQPFTAKTYNLSLSSISKQSYLFITATSLSNDPVEQPDLRVESGGELWQCDSKDQAGLCIVSGAQLKTNVPVLVTVQCIVDCRVDLEIYVGAELKMNLNEEYTVALGVHPYDFVVALKVPDDAVFTELNILATVNNPEDIDGSFEIYANVGKAEVELPSKSKYKWKGVDMWSDGKIILLKKGQDVNPGDTLKFLLQFPANLSVTLQSYTIHENTRAITMYSTIKDAVPAGGSRVYSLNLDQFGTVPQDVSLILKILKYSGHPIVQISSSQSFQPHKSFQVFSVMSTSSFTFPAWRRKQLGIGNKVFVRVKGSFDSAYELTAALNLKNMIVASDGNMEVSALEGDEVDNILFYYEVEAQEGTEPERARIDVKIDSEPRTVGFAVSRCKSLERNADTSCLIANTEAYRSIPTLYTISGRYMETMGVHYYYFEENAAKCEKTARGQTNTYLCVFQVIIWRDPSASKQQVDYEIEIRKTQSVIQLQQGFSNRGNIDAGQFKRFTFRMQSIKNVKQVRFHLTSISGNSFMYVSSKSQQKLQDYDIIVKQYAVFTKDFALQYFIAVQAAELTHYSLLAVVIRQPQPGTSLVGQMMTLDEGVAHTFTVQPDSMMNCGILLPGKVEFTVTVEHMEGMYYYYVTPIQKGIPVYTNTIAANDIHLTISPEIMNYTSSNQFLVTIKAIDHPATVSVSYSLASTGCKLFPLGKPITRSSQNVKQGQCLRFHLTKLQDMQLVITTPSLSFALDSLNITYKVDKTQTRVKSRFTKITRDQLMNMCPLMVSKRNVDQESCSLDVRLEHLSSGQPLTIIVQYTGKEIVLFDGIVQRVKGKLSNTTGRHFYYTLSRDNTVTLFIKSKTNTSFKILAKVIDFVNYTRSQEPYPKVTDQHNQMIFYSTTTQTGLTALIVPSTDIEKAQCTNCILLISVFSKGLQSETDFKIEVSQATVIVSQGQTRQGYVQKSTTVKYQLLARKDQQTIVTLNSLHQDCSQISAFSRSPGNSNTTVLKSDFSDNYAILPAPNVSLTYIVEVTGKSSCAYQISFTSTKLSVYELHQGVGVDILLDQNQKAYLLYYHSKVQSFRLLSIAQHGDVKLQGQPLNVTQVSDIESIIKDIKKKYSLQQTRQSGSLQISRSSKLFCSQCYYLFRVSVTTNLNTTILLHSEGFSVPLRQGKLIKQTLQEGDYEQYIFYSQTKFNITIDILFGSANVSVYKEGATVVKPRVVRESTNIIVPNKITDPTEFIDGYDSDSEFTIRVQSIGIQPLGYIISAASNKLPLKLTKGVPLNFHLESKQCILVPSYTEEKNLTMMLESEHTLDNINYHVSFDRDQDEDSNATNKMPNPFEHSQQKGQYNLLLKMSESLGTYTLCLQPKQTASWVSLFILGGTMPSHVSLNSQVMVKTVNDDLHIFQIYLPVKGWIMFQGFQCRGQINIIGSSDYQSVIERKPQMKFIHTKTAGHYVGKAKVDPGLYFMAVQPRRNTSGTRQQNLAIVKYSMFMNNEFPYDKFEIEDQGEIKYQYDRTYGGINFLVKKVVQSGRSFNVVNHYYRVYIASESTVLREAAICHTLSVFNKTFGFGAIMEHTPESVTLHITSTQLEQVTISSQTIFVTVICYVQVTPKQKHNSDIFRFSYNQIQLTIKTPNNQSTAFKIAIFIGLPSFVGLIVLFLTLRFCVRRIYMADTKLVQQDQAVTQNQVPATTNILGASIDMTTTGAGTGMMSIGEKESGHATPVPLPSVSDRER